MRGCSAPASARSNVVATAREDHTLIVNGKGDVYLTSGGDTLSSIYRDIAPKPQSTLRLIFSQPTANCILQISANFDHGAFVTESGQVFTFGRNRHWCCGVGLESGQEILKPTLVIALEMTPCQQVMTGWYFTIALTRSGALYSWGYNSEGQLGQGHTRDEPKPREVIVESNNGASDLVVQVSTTIWHVAAVTKVGQLFTWGNGSHGCLGHNNCCNELRLKRVEHGGFAGLFIVCAVVGNWHLAAIDSSGLVYTWGENCIGESHTLLLIYSLKAYCVVQVVTCGSTCVVLDNGQVHYFGTSRYKCTFAIKGHKIQAIASGCGHNVMVTMKGAVFGFGWNDYHQLGVMYPSALSIHRVLTPTKIFAAVTKFKEVATPPNGMEQQWPSAHQP